MKHTRLIVILITAALMQGCAGAGIVKNDAAHKAALKDKYAVFTGDIMVGRRFDPVVAEKGYAYPFEKVAPYFKDCEIVFGNLESPIVYNDRIPKLKKTGKKEVYLFSKEELAPALKAAGYNMLSLGNNHALDYKEDGLLQTMELLDAQGIRYNGVWKGNFYKPNAPVVFKIDGKKIGILSYSQVSPRTFAAGLKKYGTVPADMGVISVDVKAAKKNLDYVIVYLHWGKEGQGVQKRQKKFAKQVIDAGADLLVGSHAHLFQDIETYKGKYIFYGLGNFIFDMEADSTKYSAILKMKFKEGAMTDPVLIPVYLHDYRPEPITDTAQAAEFVAGIKTKRIKIEKGEGLEFNVVKEK